MIGPPAVVRELAAANAALVWTCPEDTRALSSAAVGGGLSSPDWVLNIGVPSDYSRTDLAQHAIEITEGAGLVGEGIALFTAARIDAHRYLAVDGVGVTCTAGIGKPTYAASPDNEWSEWSPGTINIVAVLPQPITDAAAINAVITMTEAKSQALAALNVPGTGTATDAIVVLWPGSRPEVPEQFCGPRSFLGSRLANATFDAVTASALAAHPNLR